MEWDNPEAATVCVLAKKGRLEKFAKFTGNHLALRSAFLCKMRLPHGCFLVNFPKYLRTAFLQNTYGQLLQTVAVADNCSKFVFCFLVETEKKPIKKSGNIFIITNMSFNCEILFSDFFFRETDFEMFFSFWLFAECFLYWVLLFSKISKKIYFPID